MTKFLSQNLLRLSLSVFALLITSGSSYADDSDVPTTTLEDPTVIFQTGGDFDSSAELADPPAATKIKAIRAIIKNLKYPKDSTQKPKFNSKLADLGRKDIDLKSYLNKNKSGAAGTRPANLSKLMQAVANAIKAVKNAKSGSKLLIAKATSLQALKKLLAAIS